MRIIYEDGAYREEREKAEQAQAEKEFVDISSMSEEFRKMLDEENVPDRPYKPAPTLRTEEEAAPVQETPAAPQNPAQTNYTAPVPATQQPQMPAVNPNMAVQSPYYAGQPNYYGYPQGYQQYPQQYQQYPQGYAYPASYAPQQTYGYHQQMPVYAPQQTQGYPQVPVYPAQTPVPQTHVQQAPVQQTAAQSTADNTAGTRVIYQSPDFDKNETTKTNTVQQPSFVQSAVSVSQQEVAVKPVQRAMPVIKPLPDKSFEVDDMEMSIFELNAMAHKYHVKAKAYKNPSQRSGSLEIEDCEEEAAPQPKPEFNLFEDEDEPEKEIPKKSDKKKKSKKKKRREIVRRTVLAISIIAIVISSALLYYNLVYLPGMDVETVEKTNESIIEYDEIYAEYIEEHYGDTKEPDGTPHVLTEEEKQEAISEKWDKIKKEYPNVDFPEGLQIEYATLYAENQDFVGFLKADGIGLSLPVVQTTDDDYYLKKDFYKRNTKYGTPFVTHLNEIHKENYVMDKNTVIFGHHMNDGRVFGVLDEYKTIEGYKKAPVITFDTLYNDYQWKVIAAFVTNADEKDDNGYVFRYYFTDDLSGNTEAEKEARFQKYIEALKERSLYDTGVDVRPGDSLLTLSTCSHEFDDARFVVVARLVRVGEVPEVDVSKATVNSNPRYPQAYYTKKKKENPYKDAERWYA